MKKSLFFLFFAVFLIPFQQLFAICPINQVEVKLIIVPDDYPQEISWVLKNSNGTILSSGLAIGDTLCVPDTSCLVFTIYDTYGDGICCGEGFGSYTILIDNDTAATGGQYAYQETVNMNCPIGFSCSNADTVGTGPHIAPNRDFWYVFKPDSVGIYKITTCGINTCNTVIWVYQNCTNQIYGNTNAGTLYFNDDSAGCGLQASLNAILDTGEYYYIRIGDHSADCPGSISWQIIYQGQISGCMNPTACNYNPLATLSDSSCIFPGNPNCPIAPDLVIMQDAIETSLYVAQVNATDVCMISEGCLTGYGMRDVIRFDTHIKNIGNKDYFIGDPSNNPSQFSYGNCHGHYHYEGYAEYLLYDTSGQEIPAGFKNGFCVLDLECSGGGIAKYGCGNMGISTGCGDIYDDYLDCQWIDITDVDTGLYTFVVRVNWDQSPDALGNYETTYSNNWAQVCLYLHRNSLGVPWFTLDTNCSPYTDCAGIIYGPNQYDCTGVCGGVTKRGDLNNNLMEELVDAMLYVDGILGNGIPTSDCTDLNADGEITVYDASLILNCAVFGKNHQHTGGGAHNHCNFPGGVTNINDTVTLSLGSVNLTDKYFDVLITNPNNEVVAYEFDIAGVQIINVENLIDTNEYPILPQFSLGDQKVIGISYKDSTIKKNTTPTPLCRVYYFDSAFTNICITGIKDVVNKDFESALTNITNACLYNTAINGLVNETMVSIIPNPSNDLFNVDLSQLNAHKIELTLYNSYGMKIYEKNLENNSDIEKINLQDQPSGIYFLSVHTERGTITKKLILIRK